MMFRFIKYSCMEYLGDRLHLIKYATVDKLARIYRKFKLKFVYKTHLVDSNLPPGHQYPISELLLYSSFSLLTDYVEKNLAAEQTRQNNPNTNSFSVTTLSILHLRKNYKNPLMGMTYLNEVIGQEETSVESKETASEVLILYHWWKNIRPNRQDPEYASGVTELIQKLDSKYGSDTFHVYTNREKLELDKKLDLCYTIEEEYDIEDDQMLLRLMKIRKDLLI